VQLLVVIVNLTWPPIAAPTHCDEIILNYKLTLP
jgi:hypothetical protein